MADKNINILLTLKGAITGDLAKVSRTLDKTKASLQNLEKASKQARKVAGDITFIGTAISGVFGLSLRTAANYNVQIAKTNQTLIDSFAALQVEIAQAVLPVYQKFVNVIINITKYVQNLDSALKEKLVRIIAVIGAVGVAVGLFGGFAARVFSLIIGVGKLTIVLGKLTVALYGFTAQYAKMVVLFAMSNPILAAIIVTIGLLSLAALKASKEFAVALEPFRLFFSFIEKMPGGSTFSGITKAIEGFQVSLQKFDEEQKGEEGTKSILDQIKEAIANLMKEFTKANTLDFANNFVINSQRIKDEMDRMRNYKLLGNEGFLKGFSTGINKSLSDLKNFASFGQQIAERTANTMSTYFSDMFFAVFTGDLDSLKDAFTNFTQSILRMITDIIAQYLTLSMLSSVVGGPFTSAFSATFGTLHSGGYIPYAHSGRAFDEVDVRLQKGEGVVSRKGMNAIGGKNTLKAINSGAGLSEGGQPNVIINMQTWDASDILRNKKALTTVIQNAILSNSSLRRTVKNV